MGFEERLERVLAEEPKMWFYPPLPEPRKIPGTEKLYQYVIDFRIERWADKRTYGEVNYGLAHEGLVGLTSGGEWVFFQVTRSGDALVRLATPEEVDRLYRLPPEWEKHVYTDLDVLRHE